MTLAEREAIRQLGLNVDMLDVDRLRDWARNIETFGNDLTHWASVSHLVRSMRALADNLEKEVREVGRMRSLASGEAADVLDRVRNYLGNGGFWNPEMMDHDKVRVLIQDLANEVRRLRAALPAAEEGEK